MSDMLPESREPMKVNKKEVVSRVDNINKIVDTEVTKMFDDLDIVSSDLDALMSIMKDRMIESTDCSFAIALTRLGELRMDTIKKRIDLLKTLVTDKSIETQAKKKSTSGDLESILSGAGLGMMLGARMGTSNYGNNPTAQPFDTINTETVEVIVDMESVNSGNKLQEEDVDTLLGDE